MSFDFGTTKTLEELQSHYYPGDLVANVLHMPNEFWQSRTESLADLINIARRASAMLAPSEQAEAAAEVPEHVSAELLSFLRRW